ncbi:BTAD domain-containing putative transcriptional regulator [Streptomyces marokkonensis]|uniref:BTAD domain-containing putative transcriptional regulator n=1 Tax=Streptomyces marokkonensis TaxID=324855 RepID=UPI00142F0E67|nr:BTAD domain-containing putative transcriptional regulator [Streptomyces marokkonensis]
MGGVRLRTLLIRLALESGRSVPVGSLASALWSQESPADCGHAVQALVSRLRKTLPDGTPLRFAGGGYRLDIGPDSVDALRFEALARKGSRLLQEDNPRAAARVLGEALGLWRGEPLADMSDSAYAQGTVVRLTELKLTAFEDRAAAGLSLRTEPPGMIAELESLVSLYPHRERLWSLLIRALHADGRSAEALGAYERFRTWLADQLGTDPSPELQETHLKVLRGQNGADRRHGTARDVRRDNLRAELTSFVGRNKETLRLGEQVAKHRLVTLVGTGGTGKTRLATALAGELADGMPGGVWLAELAAVTDERDVAPAVLAALGTRGVSLSESADGKGDSTDRLIQVVPAAETLIVLDNCEHVIGATARLVDDLLSHCPRLTVLATSREPLGILGETLFPVPPLELPAPGSSAATVAACPAVQLFADRADAVRPGFTVTADNASAVADICRRLDGLPLAIELAAARLRTLSVEQLAARLDDRFHLLTGGSRTARPRHRTLRAVVAWSWDLLTDHERGLAETLAVCPAAITLETAEALGGLGVRTLDTLTSLVEKSVVQVVHVPQTRFRMLETIRAYGLERLADRGAVDAALRAHARCFLALAEGAEPHLRGGAGQIGWTRALTADRDNLLAALHFACESGDADTAVRLGAALSYFWTQRGEYGQAVHLLRAALRVPGPTPPQQRAVATAGCLLNCVLSGDSVNALSMPVDTGPGTTRVPQPGDHPAAALLAPLLAWTGGDADKGLRAIDQQPSSPGRWTQAMLWLIRSMISLNEGDLQQGCHDLRRSAREFRVIGERWGLATSLTYLAVGLISQGEYDDAVEVLTEAMAPARELGGDDLQRVWLAIAHRHAGRGEAAREELLRVVNSPSSAPHLRMARLNLGDLARLEGDVGEASRQYALAHEACSSDTFHDVAFHTLYWTGTARIALARDDLEGSHRALRKALDLALDAADMLLVAIVCAAVAHLLQRRQDPESAALLLGVSHALRGASDAGNPDIAQLAAALTRDLGEAAHARAYEKGRCLGRSDAVAVIRTRLARGGILGTPDRREPDGWVQPLPAGAAPEQSRT